MDTQQNFETLWQEFETELNSIAPDNVRTIDALRVKYLGKKGSVSLPLLNKSTVGILLTLYLLANF